MRIRVRLNRLLLPGPAADRPWIVDLLLRSIVDRGARGAPGACRSWQCARPPALVTRRRSRRALLPVIAATVLMTAAPWRPAGADETCGGGKLVGACGTIDPATTIRRAAVLLSQPKLSMTAYPLLPGGDTGYRYPYELNPDPLRPSATGQPLPPPPPPPPVIP